MDLLDTITSTGLSPLIKWPGGKEKELGVIFAYAPRAFTNYYEPFVGGGAVFTAFPAKRHLINDKSKELVEFYRCVAREDESFYTWLEAIMSSWEAMLDFVNNHKELCQLYVAYRNDCLSDRQLKQPLIDFTIQHKIVLNEIIAESIYWHRDLYLKEVLKNLERKVLRMKKIELERHIMPDCDVFANIETAFMSALYMYFRGLYNNKLIMSTDSTLATAFFVFIRNYAYSGMFRYNAKGEFNVPYGGVAYNHKNMRKKVSYYQSRTLRQHLSDTNICNLDFESFLEKFPPQEDDFMFLDPPYDSEFSTYAQNEFSKEDQKRLANYLINLCKSKWMLIIKNTPFILSLYQKENLVIKSFDKKYSVSFMNRNDKSAEHLLIMNYKL